MQRNRGSSVKLAGTKTLQFLCQAAGAASTIILRQYIQRQVQILFIGNIPMAVIL
jgi:hypothetical protein